MCFYRPGGGEVACAFPENSGTNPALFQLLAGVASTARQRADPVWLLRPYADQAAGRQLVDLEVKR